jgi:hypothetical protein
MELGLLYVVFETATICSNTEQSVQHLVVFVQTLAKTQTSDLDFVRKNLSVENPLGFLVRLPNNVVLFEQTNSSITVRSCKVESIFADY